MDIIRTLNKDYAKMAKVLINRWPGQKENADIVVSLVNRKSYLCIRVGNQWYRSELGLISDPIIHKSALTTQLTDITHTSPGTPDYAIQDFTDVAGDGSQGWSFTDHDEANTVLSVIANLQTRISELESKLQDLNILE